MCSILFWRSEARIRLCVLAVLQFVTITFLSLSDRKSLAITEAVNYELARRAGFVPKRIHLGFVMGHVLLQELRFFLFSCFLHIYQSKIYTVKLKKNSAYFRKKVKKIQPSKDFEQRSLHYSAKF